MDLQMPSAGDSIDLEIIKAVKKGTLKESQLDIVVERILDLIFKTRHVLENDFTYDVKSHHQLAQRAAEESIVLLKNDDILPIKESKKITVIGEFAKTVRYQGSGSSQINPHQVDSFYDAIVSKENFKDATFSQGYDRYKDQVDHKLINDAVEKALNADIVLLFAGLTETYESEGFDRKHLNLPKNHDALIDAVSKVNDNVVVVLSNGAPVEMPWINQVSAVIEGYLTGQAGANALADIIDGTVNPSGKLAETFPIKLSDNSSHDFFPGSKHVVTYNENIFVGYRYYDTKNIETLFEFGHGLSYSTFSYSNLVAETKDGFITFKVDVKNTSDVDGYETVQIYSEKLNSKIIRAKKELIGFKKEFIKSNETKTIEFVINEEKLQFFSPITNQFEIEGGEYKIHISSSISKTECDFIHHVDCREIETNHILLSRDDLFLPNNYFDKVEVPKKFHMNATLGEIKHNFIGKRVYGMVQSQLKDFVGEMDENSGAALMVKAMVEEMPIRNLVMMSQGKISKGTMRMIIFCMNVFK
jgi:beta-glucosidase